MKVVGWSLTALALSLGAPFWFDLLNRFVSVRHGMKTAESHAGALTLGLVVAR